jgi:Spy/CpxP family protein refolding chaperone
MPYLDRSKARARVHKLRTKLLALALVAAPTSLAAQTADDGSDDPNFDGETDARGYANEAAIQARFSEMDTPESRERLAQIRTNRAQVRTLDTLAALLSSDDFDDALVERYALPLVEGQKEDAALDTISAVMLHTYETWLKADLVSSEARPSEVMHRLSAGVQALGAATFGDTPNRYRAKLIRR